MTDLPKMTLQEFQDMMATLQRKADETKPDKPEFSDAPPPSTAGPQTPPPPTTEADCIRRGICPDCGGENHSRCRPESPAEPSVPVEDPDTKPHGVHAVSVAHSPNSDAPKVRRTQRKRAPEAKPVKPDPMRRFASWVVHATRGTTDVRLPAPDGRDQAYLMAGYLVMFDWHVEVVEL